LLLAFEEECFLSTKRKFEPKIGLIGLGPKEKELFEDCFKQFRLQTVPVSGNVGLQLQREKFEGIVLPISENAEEILRAARKSPSNRRLMIFTVCKSTKDVLPYTQYGINATFEEPLDRQVVLRMVKSTYLLILDEFRKYLRIPIVLQVRLETDAKAHTGSSCELSGGGMSMVIPSARFHLEEECTVTFSLPELQAVHLHASVCWIRESAHALGVRFSERQEGCNYVKKWIDEYLGIK
jgi:PilZ domain